MPNLFPPRSPSGGRTPHRGSASSVPSGHRLRRREFLLTSALAGLAAASGATFGAGRVLAASSGAEGFGAISAFVTRQDSLNPALVERAYAQLTELDPDFGAKLEALDTALTESGSETVDAFLASGPAQDLRDTMTTITAVWYLGYTGTPDPSQESDDARFVTYRDALMWGPTSGATPIPTYSQHKMNYWAEPPASVADD